MSTAVFLIAGLAFWVAAIWGGLKGYRWFKVHAESAQRRAFEGVVVSDQPSQGQVQVIFHTYYGLIAFVTQSEYRFWSEPDQAKLVLWRLHRFNCTWGLLAYGALVIPLLSYGNYLVQKRRIGKQASVSLM